MIYRAITDFKALFDGELQAIFQKGLMFKVIKPSKEDKKELERLERCGIIEQIDEEDVGAIEAVILYRKK